MSKPRSSNSVAGSKFYPTIMMEYSEILKRDGKVNQAQFYRDNIRPRLSISRAAWYQFIGRYASTAGLIAAQQVTTLSVPNPAAPPVAQTEAEITRTLIDSPIAIQRGIAAALNIGLEALQNILSNKTTLSERDKTELLFKAMKAQDSRINAIARMKKDVREEKLFNSVFDDAVYADDSLAT